ncbi:hypothetical protein [Tellurirhabdus bombi]|uniref:hypothetical protein n=1 Tax=Tellurirhabdus bombi TaxID=2907205 RepID=UPI001F27A7A6|nr:hypothetical protein [Tellurirhabdus bombi]
MKLLKLIEVWLLGVLLLLMAFRPWKEVNHAVGLEPIAADSVATAENVDSLLMQPITVVLPPSSVDTLLMRVASKDSLAKARKKELKVLDKKLADLQQRIQKQQQNIITLEEIDAMTARQSGGGP